MESEAGYSPNTQIHQCRNCGHDLTSTAQYCPMCGQRTTTGLIPVRSLFGEYFETVFNINSRFFLTIAWLFVPGYLTKEYFKGKHVSYFRPLRLFFMTLVIMYAVLGFTAFARIEGKINHDDSKINYFATKRALVALEDAKASFGYNTLPPNERAFVDTLSSKLQFGSAASEIMITPTSNKDSTIYLPLSEVYELELDSIYKKYNITSFSGRFMTQQLIRAQKEPGNAIQSFIANTLWMILLMMPALAIVLKLFYIRKKRYYIEHLIFLAHYHSAVFVAMTAYVLLIDHIPVWLQATIPILCALFLLFAMKAYYQQGWLKTFLKYITLLFFYAILVLVFTGLTALMSLLLYQG